MSSKQSHGKKWNNAIAKRASFSCMEKRQLIKNKRDWKGTIFGVVQKNKNTEIVLRRNKQKEMTEQKYVVCPVIVCSVYTTRV